MSESHRPSPETYRVELKDLLHHSLVLRQLSVFHLIQTLCVGLAGGKIEKNEMGAACGAYGGGERCAQRAGGETLGKETTGETQT
jgi:hypothetical protein